LVNIFNEFNSEPGKLVDGHFEEVPHAWGGTFRWPTNDMISLLENKGLVLVFYFICHRSSTNSPLYFRYKPICLILQPGQLLHINKGRFHAFRKLSDSKLPESDYHHNLRNTLLSSIGTPKPSFICISLAWDWQFCGITRGYIQQYSKFNSETALRYQERNESIIGLHEIFVQHCAGKLDAKSTLTSKEIKILACIMPTLKEILELDRDLYDIAKNSSPTSKNVPCDIQDTHSTCLGDSVRCIGCNFELYNHQVRRRVQRNYGTDQTYVNVDTYCVRGFTQNKISEKERRMNVRILNAAKGLSSYANNSWKI
jgi:hypothetical protein